MRKIFLDIGAWNGKSAEFFLENHPKSKEFEIYSFECDKRNIKAIKKKKLPIKLIEAAAWMFEGKIKYYFGNDDGGTLYPKKKTGNINPDNFYEVKSIDIAKFISENFDKDDYIIMKLNCEGAEYGIIPHLKNNGLIEWVNKWYVQWHWQKIGMNETDHTNVVKMIPPAYEWDCQVNEDTFIERFKKTI